MLMDGLLHRALVQPDATAVRYRGHELGYLQLVRRGHAFARLLRAQGVQTGDRIAVVAPKGLAPLVALIGISLVGGVFVPCEPSMPPERLARILRDCEPKGLASTASIIDRVHQVAPPLIRELACLVGEGSCSLPNAIAYAYDSTRDGSAGPNVADDNPAYILYTSGTTGEPKGGVHSHLSATSFVNWAIRALHLDAGSIVANHAQWSFDLSVFDLWAALSCGARVELVPPEFSLRPKEFVQSLRSWHVTHLYSVPSMIGILESDGSLSPQGLPELRHLLYAGEPFAVPRLRAVMQCLPNANVFNLFGPTETNVCLYHKLTGLPDANTHQVPIGRPCEHLTVELLDENGRPTAPSCEGEVCVAGPSVLTEYFRRPEETHRSFLAAERFDDHRRRYRTGDGALVDEHGLYWFRGRKDRLVKRRGFRIELGEIEAVLSSEPNVKEAAAYAVRRAHETRIHVAAVLHAGRAASPLTLRAHCGRLLPAYMVPDAIELMPELPRTVNGKVDLQRLSDTSAV